MAHLKRILKDWKALEQEPLPLAAAAPRESDMTLWDGLIGVEMDGEVCPLHFLIDFPTDYPHSAPSVGFSFQFPYSGGASYIKDDGRLKGKFVVCLDLLGNFNFVHTEWKSQTGSGWSPAYSVSTLLIQLQSVLAGERWSAVSKAQREEMRRKAAQCLASEDAARLELRTHAQIAGAKGPKLLDLCGQDAALATRVERFAKDHRLDVAELAALLADVLGAQSDKPAVPEKKVDPNIVCFATGQSYTTALLGVGVATAGKNLTTAAELLSAEAFDDGLRQSTTKAQFRWFLPVWINAEHAEQKEAWVKRLERSVAEIGAGAFCTTGLCNAAVEVFPRLINQMVVEIMRPDAPKTEAIAFFEALANFWRTFRFLVDRHANIRAAVKKAVCDFVASEENRHKDRCADLGMVLAMYSVYQGLPDCPSPETFMRAYLDENFVRNVMWWKNNGVSAQDPTAVFEATRVSREICLFQQMVRTVLVGEDVPGTFAALEASNCTAPDRLERLQQAWRAQKASLPDWPAFFAAAGVPAPSRGVEFWILATERRAGEKGPKYAMRGGKGNGKGDKGFGKGRATPGRW